MRKAFIKTLEELAEKDKDIYLLTGDLGFSVFEEFAKRFPQRFINCGVAEQNMMGVAAGLALSGKKPYVYSIVPFVTIKCFEQIRNDVCYQNLNVKIVGVGGGFSYGELGATHYGIEDAALLRVLPNMTVLLPSGPVETRELIKKSYEKEGPVYIRLGRADEKEVYKFEPKIEIGKPSVLKEGEGFVFLSSGLPVRFCQEAAEELKKQGYDFKVMSLHTLKPIDKNALFKEIKETKAIFTVEEHNIIGGLASAVTEILAEFNWKGIFRTIAVPDEYTCEIGKADYLRKRYKIGTQEIIAFVLNQLKNI